MGEYLYHFSDDPTIEVFAPRVAPTQQVEGAYVWAADDTRLGPCYWFPRQCPRGTWWPIDGSGPRVHAIQWEWVDDFLNAEIYAYRFDPQPFEDFGDGPWVTTETVRPLDVAPLGSLLQRHRDAGVELRVVNDLWALWLDVIARPGLDFSGIRLKNLPQHPETRAPR
jgi:hypothetical protein